jgi:CRP/FNR family cyclic AMP-dependent transcriptional regulator
VREALARTRIRREYRVVVAELDERRRRQCAAAKARDAGSGGVSVGALSAHAFFDPADVPKHIVEYNRLATIFAQGDPCASVMYIQAGAVKLSVLSDSGKEAIVAMLGPDDFLGEGALAAQRVHRSTATAVTPSRILVVPKDEMVRLLHERPGFSDRFIEYMLYRYIRIEEDLVDQLFNSAEKQLARTLLLLARYGKQDKARGVLPSFSQEMLAEMIGTTRPRVNFFMNKFRTLGLIEYNRRGLTINSALLNVFLHASLDSHADRPTTNRSF